MKKLLKYGSVALATVSGSAFAQETSAVVTAGTDAIASLSGDIALVGAAIVGVAGVAMGIKWVKATFF